MNRCLKRSSIFLFLVKFINLYYSFTEIVRENRYPFLLGISIIVIIIGCFFIKVEQMIWTAAETCECVKQLLLTQGYCVTVALQFLELSVMVRVRVSLLYSRNRLFWL